MIGGSTGSFMGEIHRKAIQQSGCLKLVCGAFGSTRNSSYETGKMLKMPTRRVYGTYRDMFRRENMLPADERMDFITIVTPNAMHYPIAMSALDAHFPIFSEKPFTCNMDEAMNLTRKQRMVGLHYGVSMAYPSYPMVRKAREMVLSGEGIGALRKLVVSYELGWMAPRLENAGNRQAGWRADPRRCGPAGCLADLCAHCFYLAEWLTGQKVSEVLGDLRPTVPGRVLDDDCTVIAKFESGLRGLFISSQIASGSGSGLAFKAIGDKATMEWSQQDPGLLRLRQVDGTETVLKADPPAQAIPVCCSPTPYGDNEPYIQALAGAYKAFANDLAESQGKAREPATPAFYMTIDEGLRSVAFVDAVLKNTAVPLPQVDETKPPPPPATKWEPLTIPEIPTL